MLNVVGLEYGQLNGTANAVVGTQRGALGAQPLAVDIGLDGIEVEVELHIHQLVAHHVHVALQDDGLALLVAWRGAFAYDDVTRLVDVRLQMVALAP